MSTHAGCAITDDSISNILKPRTVCSSRRFVSKVSSSTLNGPPIAQAALQLKQFSGPEIAIIASGRMTNEELWLTAQLAKSLGAQWIDVVPRREPGDSILLSEDRNPNTNGARLILGSKSEPGANLVAISEAVKSGKIKALLILKENAMHLGVPIEQLAQLPVLITMNILSNEATKTSTVVLPACGFAEKRGSMITGKGRLQRLNRAVR